ncbi:SDR family NAD(P)-dependent oxidoreductase [Mangrovitalea sediminis]|uniref:SDR family NAD(P)-dependent oxidoreductase n=1 Tax=Mangrovitalea sediminis TaxID=1982043 RepID=UPI000BE534FF|nr:SDR family NAD(P)-dependent oxidoreductase [Mangrovitalea sediminis]
MKSFNHKVAAITGAASGIGRALALALADQQCQLALSDVDENGLAETARLASAKGVKVTTAKVDVANRDQVHAWADQVKKDHGKVNLIFNNAGVAHGGTVEGSDYADYEWIIGINLWGVIHGTKAFLPYLKETGDGHVINISSIFGIFAQPTQSAYNTTKFAVRGFTESLRQELDIMQCGVSATCVHPGGIKTNIAHNARMSKSIHEVAGDDVSDDDLRDNFAKMFRTTPEKAAQVILEAVRHNDRRVLIGADARIADRMQRLLPASYQRLVTAAMQAQRRSARRHAKA